MNYFEFFELKPQFEIDLKELRQKYLANSRKYHPDFALAQGMDSDEAMEASALNNKAFKILNHLQSRTAYLLELKGLLGDEKEQLPMDFLMEMMEINEGIMELEMEFDENAFDRIKSEYEAREIEIDEGLKKYQKKYDEDSDINALEEVKNFYLKNKYILRIKKSIDTFATR